MIEKEIQDALNVQIKEELYSAYLYFSMVSYFKSMNLNGFAQWMEVQAQEEVSHAMRFFNFVNERGGKVDLLPLEGPKTTWKSPAEAIEDALNHEQFITSCIHKLVELASVRKDYPTGNMLQWFVDEQVEEEANVSDVLEKLRMVGDKGQALYMLDKEMGTRQPGPDITGEAEN